MDSSLILPITILILIAILFLMVSLNKRKISATKKKRIIEDLYELQKNVSSNELALRRDSIIKLDNLLSKSLQLYFKNNSSCGDNLKNANKLFRKKKYNDIWEIHKMRNKIVHDDYEVSEFEATKAFDVYKFAILKILQ